MATNYPSTQNTGNLVKYMQEIPLRGIPNKITIEHLISLGFKSLNDRPIIQILKFIKVIDPSGIPNDSYKQLRNRGTAKKYLGHQLKESYSDLFQLYPDACNKDAGTLKDFFATHTSGGEATLRNIVQTFQALCSIAEFDESLKTEHHEPAVVKEQKEIAVRSKTSGPTNADIHFNIQVHIPGDQKPEVYETIFKNLGKYVLGISHEE